MSHPQVGQLLTPRRSSKAESGWDVTVMPLAMALGGGAAPILGYLLGFHLQPEGAGFADVDEGLFTAVPCN